MDNSIALAYQTGQTYRANQDARDWEQAAREWRAYADTLQRELTLANDRLIGISAVMDAFKTELLQRSPENMLNDVDYRIAIRNQAINSNRVSNWNMPPLSDEELQSI